MGCICEEAPVKNTNAVTFSSFIKGQQKNKLHTHSNYCWRFLQMASENNIVVGVMLTSVSWWPSVAIFDGSVSHYSEVSSLLGSTAHYNNTNNCMHVSICSPWLIAHKNLMVRLASSASKWLHLLTSEANVNPRSSIIPSNTNNCMHV